MNTLVRQIFSILLSSMMMIKRAEWTAQQNLLWTKLQPSKKGIKNQQLSWKLRPVKRPPHFCRKDLSFFLNWGNSSSVLSRWTVLWMVLWQSRLNTNMRVFLWTRDSSQWHKIKFLKTTTLFNFQEKRVRLNCLQQKLRAWQWILCSPSRLTTPRLLSP